MNLSHSGFTWLDGLVLGGYFFGITIFGLWIARRVKSSGSYFLGERKLKWWIMVGQAFGTGTHAEQPVAQTGAVFHLGFATIWYQWKNMLITPFYWLMAPWYRRSEKTTIGEILEERYSRKLGFTYSVFAICYFIFNQGAMLKGAGKLISIATGGDVISPNGVVLAMTVAFIFYSFFGGLLASAYTDFVQSFLIIVLSFMLIPLGLRAVGGFHGMRASLPPDFFNLYSEISGLTWFTISMLALNGFVGITAQPHCLTMMAAGNTERAGRIGQTYGALVKRFCTIGWALTGLVVAAYTIQKGIQLPDREAAFGFACRELLVPGLTGLMLACVLAANMSTCSNFMVNTGALFTKNIYLPYINSRATDKQILWMGKISGLALTVFGILFALIVRQVLDAFLFTETIAALMGIVFVGGLFWKRANRHGAFAAIFASFLIYYALNFLMSCHPDPTAKPYAALWPAWQDFLTALQIGNAWHFLSSGSIQLVYPWMPAPYGWATLAGFIALIVVSLLTKPEDPKRIERFFDNMRRTTDNEGLPEGAPKPLANDRGQDLILLDLPGWLTRERWRGFFHRYREDIFGFLVAWLSVGLLVAIAWGIMQIGR